MLCLKPTIGHDPGQFGSFHTHKICFHIILIFSPNILIFPTDLFPGYHPTRILHEISISLTRATYLARINCFNFTTLVVLVEFLKSISCFLPNEF